MLCSTLFVSSKCYYQDRNRTITDSSTTRVVEGPDEDFRHTSQGAPIFRYLYPCRGKLPLLFSKYSKRFLAIQQHYNYIRCQKIPHMNVFKLGAFHIFSRNFSGFWIRQRILNVRGMLKKHRIRQLPVQCLLCLHGKSRHSA